MNHYQHPSIIRFYSVMLTLLVAIFSTSALGKENLQLDMTGEIKTLCLFNMGKQTETLYFTDESTTSLPINLYCNQPMVLEIKSEYGGMKHKKHESIIPYLLKVDIPNASINTTIPSKNLFSTVQLSSEDIPYQAAGSLTILLQENNTFSGSYQDKITMNLAPKLVINLE